MPVLGVPVLEGPGTGVPVLGGSRYWGVLALVSRCWGFPVQPLPPSRTRPVSPRFCPKRAFPGGGSSRPHTPPRAAGGAEGHRGWGVRSLSRHRGGVPAIRGVPPCARGSTQANGAYAGPAPPALIGCRSLSPRPAVLSARPPAPPAPAASHWPPAAPCPLLLARRRGRVNPRGAAALRAESPAAPGWHRVAPSGTARRGLPRREPELPSAGAHRAAPSRPAQAPGPAGDSAVPPGAILVPAGAIPCHSSATQCHPCAS